MSFSNKDGRIIVLAVIEEIIKNRNYLSEIDAAVGDGDHGINMSKGFQLAKDEIDDKELTMSEGFMVISKVLVSKIGGSMGPLYGSFFRGLSIASKDKEVIDGVILEEMLTKAYSNISMVSNANIGDKTLIDVLDPAILVFKEKLSDGNAMEDCLREMIEAARRALENTKEMVAKVGRASRLGSRSIGHQDAGATSCFLILQSLAKSVILLEGTNKEE